MLLKVLAVSKFFPNFAAKTTLNHNIMQVRMKFKSAADAEKVAEKLPVNCSYRILKDRTSDAYLEIPESYEDYVERYLISK